MELIAAGSDRVLITPFTCSPAACHFGKVVDVDELVMIVSVMLFSFLATVVLWAFC